MECCTKIYDFFLYFFIGLSARYTHIYHIQNYQKTINMNSWESILYFIRDGWHNCLILFYKYQAFR